LRFTGLYLDSNALICALEGDDEELRESFRRLFKTVIFFQMHTSELSLAELLVDPHRRGDDQLIERYKRLFQTSRNGFVKVMPVSTSVLTWAASFRGRQMRFTDYRTKLADSIHAATAYLSGCSHFMTSDHRFKLWDQIRKLPATVDGISELLEEIT
jgi:predicted nucleic acid-binding protein